MPTWVGVRARTHMRPARSFSKLTYHTAIFGRQILGDAKKSTYISACESFIDLCGAAFHATGRTVNQAAER